MKKLMLAVAIVCAAAIAQAATVTWSSAKLFTNASEEGGFSTTPVGSKATGYLFIISATEYNSFATDFASTGSMESVWNTYKDGLDSALDAQASANRTSVITLTSEANVNDTVYGAVIYTYTDSVGGKDFYLANIATGTVGADSGLTISGLGTTFLGTAGNGGSTGGWVAVPEPTSALMLLVGLAGLALKRKVA